MSNPQIPHGSQLNPSSAKALFPLHPITGYFALTFAISWTAAFLVAAPRLLHGEPLPKLTGILMLPAMLLGPVTSGILLTRIVDGKAGLRDLLFCGTRFAFQFAGMHPCSFPQLSSCWSYRS